MTILDAFILGIVEGITEYLPVSSTGHLILVSRWLGLAGSEEARKSIDTFNIVVQGAAVLAVLGLYRFDVLRMIRAMLASVRLRRESETHRRDLRLARNLFLSFLPAAIIGKTLGDWFEARFFAPGPVIAALALGGVVTSPATTTSPVVTRVSIATLELGSKAIRRSRIASDIWSATLSG